MPDDDWLRLCLPKNGFLIIFCFRRDALDILRFCFVISYLGAPGCSFVVILWGSSIVRKLDDVLSRFSVDTLNKCSFD